MNIILSVLFVCAFSFNLHAQYNSIRIAFYGGLPLPDNYLKRAKDAGYTHVMAGVGEIDATEWSNGVYSSTTNLMRDNVAAAFNKCFSFGLKFIPSLPSFNRWSTTWRNANNSEIYYQYYIANNLSNEVLDDGMQDDLLLNFIRPLLGKSTTEFNVSNVPSYAYHEHGLDKTFRSLVKDVILGGFIQTGLPQSEFDLVMLGNDEPCTYDANVPYNQKLLIGRSQEDLNWIFQKDPFNFGVTQRVVPSSLPSYDFFTHPDTLLLDMYTYDLHEKLITLQDEFGRKTRVFDNVLYLYDPDDPGYQAGVRALIADFYQRRVQDVIDFIPNVRCIFYGDLFDPEHLGGYLKTAQALSDLSTKTLVLNDTIRPIQEKLIFMPWLYTNSFTHELESKLGDVNINTSTTRVAVGLSAAYRACEATFPPGTGLTTALLRAACKAGVTKYAYDQLITKNSVDIEASYKAMGGKYDINNTMSHFFSSGFNLMFMNSFEKEDVTSHTLSNMVKMMGEPANLPQPQKDMMLGYGIVAWGNPPESNTNTWNVDTTAYCQHFTYNNLEIFSANFNWKNDSSSLLFFNNFVLHNKLSLFYSIKPLSVVDYFVTMKDKFNNYLNATPDSLMSSANFWDALLFCNLLSIREGLEPVYDFIEVQYNSLWHTMTVDCIVSSYDVRGPVIMHAIAECDYSKSGYRLPNAAEMLAISGDVEIIPDCEEWVWGVNPLYPASLFLHNSVDTILNVEDNIGHPFRVVRSNQFLPKPKLSVFSLDECIATPNLSKPRIYVQNGSSFPLSKFTVHYYFTVEQNKSPELAPYWVPGSTVNLHKISDSLYEVQYYFSGVLDTGNTITPSSAGNVVGLHYSDWSAWDKTNDQSFNNSSSFVKNENIVVTDSNGIVIYGFLPGGVVPSLPDTSIVEEGALAISGSGIYSVPTSGITLTYNNSSFHHGMMFTIRNMGQNDSVSVEWYGVREQNNSGCQYVSANLYGNGAQINNVCTSKDSNGNMHIKLQSRSACNIQLEVFDWVNGSGCN